MAEKITTEYGKMRKSADELEALSSQLEKQLRTMEGYIEQLAKVWQSESAQGYINDYRAREEDLKKLSDSMHKGAQKIALIVNNYTQTDNRALESVNKLMGG